MTQNLFTEEELAKVTDEAERKHLIECAQDQSKIDLQYMKIMGKYDLWEKEVNQDISTRQHMRTLIASSRME